MGAPLHVRWFPYHGAPVEHQAAASGADIAAGQSGLYGHHRRGNCDQGRRFAGLRMVVEAMMNEEEWHLIDVLCAMLTALMFGLATWLWYLGC